MQTLDIYKIRRKEKLTQAEFGKLIGVTRHTIAKWEDGSTIPPSKKKLIIRIFPDQPVIDETHMEKKERDAIEQMERLRAEMESMRSFLSLQPRCRVYYIRRELSDMLMRYSAAGYDTLDLFRNAVLAVYPKSDFNFYMVWEFQCFRYPEEDCSLDDLDTITNMDRALVVLTQKTALS